MRRSLPIIGGLVPSSMRPVSPKPSSSLPSTPQREELPLDQVAAAVFVYRILIWLLPIPFGGVAFTRWREEVPLTRSLEGHEWAQFSSQPMRLKSLSGEDGAAHRSPSPFRGGVDESHSPPVSLTRHGMLAVAQHFSLEEGDLSCRN